MHIHGAGGHGLRGPGWMSLVAAVAALGASFYSVLRGGWQVLWPFGIGALILLILVCFMRAIQRDT